MDPPAWSPRLSGDSSQEDAIVGLEARKSLAVAGPIVPQTGRVLKSATPAPAFNPLVRLSSAAALALPIAAKHYLQVTDEHFKEAVRNPVQQPAEMGRKASRGENRPRQLPRAVQGVAAYYELVPVRQVAEEGLEQPHEACGLEVVSETPGATSDVNLPIVESIVDQLRRQLTPTALDQLVALLASAGDRQPTNPTAGSGRGGV